MDYKFVWGEMGKNVLSVARMYGPEAIAQAKDFAAKPVPKNDTELALRESQANVLSSTWRMNKSAGGMNDVVKKSQPLTARTMA